MNNNEKKAYLYNITYMDVFADDISTVIKDFGYFACVDIRVGDSTITIHTKTAEDALGIIKNLGRAVYEDNKKQDSPSDKNKN